MQTLAEVVDLISKVEYNNCIYSVDIDFASRIREKRLHLDRTAFHNHFKVYELEGHDATTYKAFVIIKGVKIFCLMDKEE